MGRRQPETLDIYGSGKKAFVFVHGGAWRRQSSREQAFPAEPIIAAGAAYVALNFANLPAVTLPEMAAQVCRGIEWVHDNLSKEVVLCGHSSGGHLAACALDQTALREQGAGRLRHLRPPAGAPERAQRIRAPRRAPGARVFARSATCERIRCPVTVAWAREAKRAEFYRQSRGVRRRAGRARRSIGKGLNHFEIVETLADPRSPLGRAALNMLQ